MDVIEYLKQQGFTYVPEESISTRHFPHHKFINAKGVSLIVMPGMFCVEDKIFMTLKEALAYAKEVSK